MGRPLKKPEERRKEATLRLDPEVRHKLMEAATKAERSFAADLEARLVATCDLDQKGVELVHGISRQISQIQKMTDVKWHRQLKTWGAVAEMLRIGPIHEFNPDPPEGDEDVTGAFEMLEVIQRSRSDLIDQLADMGIAARQDPDKLSGEGVGIAKLADPTRGATRLLCEKIDDPLDKAHALDLLGEILQLDEQARQANASFKDALRLHLNAINAGRKFYRDYLRREAERKKSEGEPYNIMHLVDLDP
ncbi:hypothetical protein [Sphingorhabdus sp.]|jgi:hypothetical protein|uniref:hypothetical protein n=1 Tax=Sphingorhabdus sp. TaxID=1902408 RepID=UPI0037845D87